MNPVPRFDRLLLASLIPVCVFGGSVTSQSMPLRSKMRNCLNGSLGSAIRYALPVLLLLLLILIPAASVLGQVLSHKKISSACKGAVS